MPGMSMSLGMGLTRNQGGPLWTPLLLGSALSAWWDASASATLTLAGSNVSAWASRVGSITATQATGANQPVYGASARNGKPGITSDGSNDFMSFPAASLPTDYVTVTVAAYAGTINPGSWRRPFAYGSGDNTSTINIVRHGAQNLVGELTLGTKAGVDWSAADRLVIVTKSGTAGSLFVDGASGPTGTFAASLSLTTGYIFRGITYEDYWPGTVQQVLVTSVAVSTTDREKIEGWESWIDGKAGANLPAGHPYKSAAPRASLAECEQWADEQGWRVIGISADRGRARLIYTPPRRLIVPSGGWRSAG